MKQSGTYHLLYATIMLLTQAVPCQANEHPTIFAGGMGVYTGYSLAQNDYGSMDGMVAGVGGRLVFNLGKHFRAGGLGGTIHLGYENPGIQGSYCTIGFGGLTGEAGITLSRLRLFGGVLLGGDKLTNLHIRQRDGDTVTAIFSSTPSMMVSPLVTVDYLMTKSISVMLGLQCLIGANPGANGFFYLPAVQFGVLFNK